MAASGRAASLAGVSRVRRRLLQGGGALAWAVALRPARGAPGEAPAEGLAAAVAAFTGGVVPTPGRVTLEVAPLVENGNAVPITLRVESPMTTDDRVRRVALFNERNPERDVLRYSFGPAAGRAEVHARIRLATSQRLVAVAQTSDGRWWQAQADVIVTLAACIE